MFPVFHVHGPAPISIVLETPECQVDVVFWSSFYVGGDWCMEMLKQTSQGHSCAVTEPEFEARVSS